jgi:CBS domain containing-hemolysin-like protein
MQSLLTWGDGLQQLGIVFGLIALNAFFVATEFAVVSVRRSRMGQLAHAGDTSARTVQKLQRRMTRILSTTQLGITLSSLALGWIGERTVGGLVRHGLSQFAIAHPTLESVAQREVLIHSLSLPIAFLGVAYLQIVLGELCPKALALLYPEQSARFLAPFGWTIARVFAPIISLLELSTRLVLRLLGVQDSSIVGLGQITAKELQFIIETDSESGLQARERQFLSNLFEFSTVSAGEVMVPRANLVTLSHKAVFADLLEVMTSSRHSIYPVVADSLDEVLGVIDFRALAEPLKQSALHLDTPITDWIQDVQFVPESIALHELLGLMQQAGQELAIVVDEYGGTAGLVTLMDLMEEVFDGAGPQTALSDPRFQLIDEQTYHIQAQVEVAEVNDYLDLDLPLSETYTTLGGFLIQLLQHVPQVGEHWQYQNLSLTVLSKEGNRLHLIQLSLLPLASVTEVAGAGA